MPNRRLTYAFVALGAGFFLPMCQTKDDRNATGEAPPVEVSAGGAAGGKAAPPTEVASGAGGAVDPLYSDVFGTGGIPPLVEDVPPCNYSTPGCDFARIDGCCSPKACAHASGADVFDTYPVESCEALVECVQSHPGCSTEDDPLCFQDEAPGAPCLQEGYLASHTDPDGPFAWTAELMACVCGY